MNWPRHGRFVLTLGLIVLLWSLVMGLNPLDRSAWLLESVLVWLALLGLALSYRRFPLSRVSYSMITLFLILHIIGSHYTYAEVPYDAWWERLTGSTLSAQLDLQRNHFDRLVHFLYGLLLAYPIREVFVRIARVEGFWGYFLPLDLTMSSSMLYELIEWGAAEWFGGDLGMAYLGTQGDVWDAHKDMALASLGALITMLITALINSRLQRDFAREWQQSLTIKGHEPLGEEEIRRMIEEKS